jgi:hypothetical protein
MTGKKFARIAGRARQLSMSDWSLLLEAFVTLSASSAAIRFDPFAKVGRMASRPAKGLSGDTPERVAWAVRACAHHVPWRAVCFQQGLAAQLMLRRRGFDSTLYFGAASRGPGGVSAHVWVKLAEREVIGCEEAGRFTVLAAFPPTDDRTGGSAWPRRFDDA